VIELHKKSHFLPLDKPKTDFSSDRIALKKVIFCLLTSPKFDFGEVEKAMFEVVAKHWEIIFSSTPTENATLLKSKKRCFKGSHVTLNTFSAS